METIENVLKYIQLYTECNDFTLKRIGALLEKLPKERLVEKVIKEKEIVYIQKKSPKLRTLDEWASKYLKENDIKYEVISARRRDRYTLILRNQFCIEAYKCGFSYSLIAKYLNMHHATIMHCVNKIKRV